MLVILHLLGDETALLCAIGGLTSILTSINSVTAQQVTSDGTVSTTVTTPDGKNFNINDGTTRQGNLFHSFKEFSIPTGGSANFNNAADVRNIIGRVTGGSVSSIDGLIKTLNPANLFLLNPAGIIFGPNASLNIGGSFLGTTAHSFLFDNGFEFSATDPQAPPLLTINVPIGLRFRDNPGNITTKYTTNLYPTLEVPSGKTITLVGGNISLDGPDLVARGGRVELGGLSAAGTVRLNTDGSLNFPVGAQLGDVSLTNQARVIVSADKKGSIAVNARNLDISGGSGLYAGIGQGLGTVGSQAGDIRLNASGTTKVANGFVVNRVDSGAVGNSGNIIIETGKLNLSNGGRIVANTLGQGNAGNLTVNASDSVELNGEGQGSTLLTSQVSSTGTGNAGELVINTKRLSVTNGAEVSTGMYGEGNGGNLLIKAGDLVEVIGTEKPGGASGLGAGLESGGIGKGGDLTIDTKKLVVRNAQVSAGTSGKGDGGNLTVRASDSVELSGKVYYIDDSGKVFGNPTGLFAQVESTAEGNGGKLFIETRRLSVGDGAKVQVATFGQGNAGDLFIRASDIDVFETPLADSFPAGIYAGVQVDSDEPPAIPPKGFGGTITIETDRLRVRDGARVSTTTEGLGDAGKLLIRANESVEVSGILLNPNGKFDDGRTESQISAAATATPKSTGSGGSVSIETPKLIVRDGGTVTVRNESSDSTKPAGNLEINARSINLDNQGSITATTQSGNGGNIILGVQDLLLLRRNSNISRTYATGTVRSLFIST